MRARVAVVCLSCALAVSGPAASGEKAGALSPERPRLKLRASPEVALPPVRVMLVAELVGGNDREEFYCPAVEWDFDNGRRSTQEGDCEPFGNGSTMERRFVSRQAYLSPGQYRVTVTLRRADRVLARAAATVEVAGGIDASGPFSASRR